LLKCKDKSAIKKNLLLQLVFNIQSKQGIFLHYLPIKLYLPALDGAEDVSLFVWEAGQTSSLILERGLAFLLHVCHVAQIPNPNLR
jgi:hypothetical protein